MIWLLCLLVSILAVKFLIFRKRPKNYPPGPSGLPIVGNLLQLHPNRFEVFSKLRKEYGDVFSVDLGSMRAVILNDYKLVKEAYSRAELAGRPLSSLSADENGIIRGIGFTEGRVWMEQRRFALKNLRDFGFGVKSIDSRLQQEALETINELKSKVGIPINMYEQFDAAAVNSLWEIAAGERYAKDDPEFIKLRYHVSRLFTDGGSFFVCLMFPWMKYVRPGNLKAYKNNYAEIHNIVRIRIKEHRETYADDVQRDLIDCYLKQIMETTDSQSSFYKESGDINMVYSITDMIFAGVETLSVALSWITLTMAHYPEAQDKIYAEIQSVVGLGNLPSLSNKAKMPYTQAVIMEVIRFTRFVPQSFRKATENVELNGYIIPKDTAVFANFTEIAGDPKVWGDPDNFRPERFISEDGQNLIKHEAFVYFSVGKRACPGESYAKDQLFMFVAILFQHFKIDFDENSVKPTLEGDPGAFTLYPKSHKLVLSNRQE